MLKTAQTLIAILVSTVIFCLLPLCASAQTINFKYMGSFDCGSWQSGDSAYESPQNAMKLNFILGYLAGKSFHDHRNLLANVTQGGVYAYVSRYCSNHPLETILSATIPLERELLASAPRSD